MDVSGYFAGKKITVVGLGLLGRGVGDIRYLATCGADLIVTDLKTSEALATSLEQLQEFSNITYVLGQHRLEDFRDRDLIIKAAGVPLDSPYIEEARKNGIPIKMTAALFAELSHLPIIGITGTRGKSTTTHMLHAILQAAGKKVLLGGNVRGVSNLALLPDATPEHIGLFELDSWQLQGFGEAKISPHLSLFTTFFSDHLNYYHDDLDAYLADKANIFLFQKPEDTLVIGSQCAALLQEKYSAHFQGWVTIAGESDLPTDWKLKIPGTHNRYDAALALAAARSLNILDSVTRTALEKFGGVPGRLEFVRTLDDVAIYNDTTATTPEATIAALQALRTDLDERASTGKILLIMGGADKSLQMEELLTIIAANVSRVALLSGTGTERIRELLPEAEVYDNLAAAFGDVRRHAQPGDVIVFSPAFASFGMFVNEYDRGDQFTNMVNEL